jgi:hypothetical protein
MAASACKDWSCDPTPYANLESITAVRLSGGRHALGA